MENIIIGRQPIYNRLMKVVGYELLFRNFECDGSVCFDGDKATTDVILNTFMEIGLDELVGSGLAFINLTRNFLTEHIPIPMQEDRVVLEVLENIEIDKQLIASLKKLSDRGYKIALDDVVDVNDVKPLLEIADIVKLEILGVYPRQIEQNVAMLKKTNVRILAEKVESHDEFEFCKRLGCDYFQGFFFSKPNIVTGRRIPESRMALLRLLSRLQAPGIEFSEMDEIIRQDVSISYKLLRLINSSYYARPKKIDSIRQALTLLGIRQIRDWVSLLSLSTIDDKPRELMVTAIIRGKMVETLAQKIHLKNSVLGFTVGLFSVLDALLDKPITEILESLPLTQDVSQALGSHEGKLGGLLNNVLLYEHGMFEDLQFEGFGPEQFRDAYLAAVNWSNAVSGML